PEWRIADPERRSTVASAMHRLLVNFSRIPGTDSDGKIDAAGLTTWLTQVRALSTQYGRTEIGDDRVGQLLSMAPPENTEVWPCLPVCKAMEQIASQKIAEGFTIGALNSRGAHFRMEGGGQERDLAAKYRGFSQKLTFDYPFVSS